MPGLRHSLGSKDFNLLMVIVDQWEFDVVVDSVAELIDILEEKLSNEEIFISHYRKLSDDEKDAIMEIFYSDKRIPWSLFIRRFGGFREMGVAKRDREQPFRSPISTVEKLWYQGLIGRDFLKTQAGIEEFAYIPDEFHNYLKPTKSPDKTYLGTPASSKDVAITHEANDSIIDLICTLLAGIRTGVGSEELLNHWEQALQYMRPISISDLKVILIGLDLLESDGTAVTPNIGEFLEIDRGNAHVWFVQAWIQSNLIQEMKMVPDFRVEGKWYYDPCLVRNSMINLLIELPRGKWWSLHGFIESVKSVNPDYLRSAGDYDSWLIRSTNSEEYLRGFQYWDDVDGKFLHFMITGPFNWLGIVDLASPVQKGDNSIEQIAAFRLSNQAYDLINGQIPQSHQPETEKLLIRSDGSIYAPKGTPRKIRYQLARFSDWKKMFDGSFTYQISTGSLTRGREQGLNIHQMVSILKHGTDKIPPSLLLSMERWAENGLEASILKVSILRVRRPEILQSIKKSKVSRFLGDPLGSTAIIIKPGGEEKIRSALLEMGFLAEIEIE